MCGFVGLLTSSGDAAPSIYEALIGLQHRGQDAAGMATFSGTFHLKKGLGLVRDVFREKNMARLTGSLGVGHVRYPTIGAGRQEDAQPFLTSYPYGLAISHNGNVTNYDEIREQLVQDRTLVNSTCDVEVLLHTIAIQLASNGSGALDDDTIFESIGVAFDRVRGTYSAALAIAGVGLVAMRDPHGIKPAVHGRRTNPDGGVDHMVASENVALDIAGFDEWDDIAPGEVIVFRPGREPARRVVRTKPHTPCVFELVYFARPDSILDDHSVYEARRRFGVRLADKVKERGLDVDVVMPVPDSACTSAATLAQALGFDYREGFVKNRYVGRTFIMPDQKQRNDGIRRKLNTIPLEFEGRRVLLVDDSIVRGNTSRKIVELARKAGATEVHFASCSPPVRFPCVYGIDMATRKELIARDRDETQIAKSIGADSVIYQEIDDLTEAAGNGDGTTFCSACFSGHYPTGDVTPETLESIETERLCVRD